jgi:C-terminal peptidase prc
MSKAKWIGLLGCLVVVAGVLPPARAAEDAKDAKPKSFIVLVGINNYADPQIEARKHAEADARALYDLFTDKKYLGVEKDHVKLLLGKADARHASELATRENILKALTWAATHAGKDDLVVFAFFGEGAPLGDRTCFFGTDSTFKDRAKNAVASADIEHALEKLKSQRFCAFIDVNFKGFKAGTESVAEADSNDLLKAFLKNEDKEDPTVAPGRALFLATGGLRPSPDLDKHSIFAKVLLDGLKGAADKDGYEPDGVITVDELADYVNKELPALTKKHAPTKDEKEQFHYTHHILRGATNHFVLTHNPEAYPKAQERLTKLAQLAADKKIAPAIAEEGEKLLNRMPKLKAQQDLRKDFQQLADGKLTVEEFLKDRKKILDSTKLRNADAVEFATKVMAAVNMVRNDYVKELNQGELVGWALRGLVRRCDEKQLLTEVSEKLASVKGMKQTELLTLLSDVRQKLGKREDLDKNKDVDIAVQQMLSKLDPYTNYIDQETKDRMHGEMTGEFSGIGIQIRKDATTDYLLVVTPIKGSPGYKAGLKAGDLITTVTREVDSLGNPLDKPDTFSTKDLPLGDAVKKILGKAGTKVKITVERKGEARPMEFEITRGRVEVESVLGCKRKTDDSWDYVIDPESKIVYVRLTSFARKTFEDLERVVNELDRKKGIKGLVLDLRFNPGGLLTSATEVCDLFIDDGWIVGIKPRGADRPTYTSGKHEGSLLHFPMVCMVNGGSASGSEIVAGCLQDHHRALIMGERSYGKGSVQNIQRFKLTGGEIKLTTATFWRPSGKNINKSSTKGGEDEDWGILPDKGYLLKLTPKERDELFEHMRDTEIIPRRDMPAATKPEYKDKQLEMALDYLRKQIKTAAKAPVKKAG